MQLTSDGARRLPSTLTANEIQALEGALAAVSRQRPGSRLAGLPALAKLLASTGPVGRHAAAHLGAAARPVRALLFNKTAEQNWSLGWHQDRTIAVRERIETAGFSNWTVKSGMHHVEPPFGLLERMLTLRVHLDAVGAGNAPLLIAPGSHRLARIPEADISATVRRLGAIACFAEPGDLWIYSTPILHASEAAASPTSRRVLQVDYSADDLPPPLEWLGV